MSLPATIVDALFLHAERRPDDPFLTFLDGRSVATTTFAELLAGASSVAAELDNRRVEDHVMLVHPNGPGFFTDFLGVVLSSRVPVPVAPPTLLRHPDGYLSHLDRVASRCDTSTVLTTLAQARNLPTAAEFGLRTLTFDSTDRAQPPALRPTPAPSDVAFLQFTSGSTTRPRGVRVTHGNIAANIDCLVDAYDIDENSTCCTWLPMFHDMGLIGCGLALLLSGGHLVLMTPTSFLRRPSRWLDAITSFEATHAPTPCFGLDHVLQRVQQSLLDGVDLSSLRHLIIGGDVINPRTVRSFCAVLEPYGLDAASVRPSYGMAEATLLVAADRGLHTVAVSRRRLQIGCVERPSTPEDEAEIVACGPSVPGHRVEVLGPDASPANPGEQGELVFSGPSVTDGYHSDEEATAQVFFETLGGDRALRSGDLGFVLDGNVYVTGRAKDLIIVRGRNIHPEDVEAVIAAREIEKGDELGAVAVIAVDTPDGEGIVVVQEARGADDRLTIYAGRIVASVIDACDLRPVEILFAPLRSLPRTSSGKLQRSLCKNLYAEGRLRITRCVPCSKVRMY